MNEITNIQLLIEQAKTKPCHTDIVDFDWYGATTPLVIPDKVNGEWHLQTAKLKQSGAWELRYCYHASPRWCIVVETCDGFVELADSRYQTQAGAVAEAANLNRVGIASSTTNRFKVQEIQ